MTLKFKLIKSGIFRALDLSARDRGASGAAAHRRGAEGATEGSPGPRETEATARQRDQDGAR